MFNKHLAALNCKFGVESLNLMCRVYTKKMIEFLQEKQMNLFCVEPFFLHTNLAHHSLPNAVTAAEKLLVAELGPVTLDDIKVIWRSDHAEIRFSVVSCRLSANLVYSNFTKNQ